MLKILLPNVLLIIAVTANAVPRTAEELWKDYDSGKEPLEVKSVIEWDNADGHFKLITYSLGELKGTNKSAKPRIAAYYGYPKTNKKKMPAILHIHGGGQRAGKGRVEYWVKLGYASISINWGGKVLEEKDTPNTDWDGLAAGFIGSRDETHHNTIDPGPNTLFKEPHGFNSSWNLIAMAAKRALTFLEQQPIVDASKLGVEGHSMGGRSTVLTAIDPRIKAASPSVGGSGYLYQDNWGLKGSARRMQDNVELYEKLVSAQSYWKLIKCPILFLGASNDFNSPTESVIRGMANLPASTDRRLALAPHLNHRFTTGTSAARTLWFEACLKGNFDFPKQSRADLVLKTGNGIPVLKVWPESSRDAAIEKVDIYYSYGRNPHIRFWRDGMAKKIDHHYEALCPVFDINEPLFAFANITYRINRKLTMPPGCDNPTEELTITSDYKMIYPPALKNAGVKTTEKPRRLLDDFSRGWHDWFRLNPANPQHFYYATRKIIDPCFMGPKNGKLAVTVVTTGPGNSIAVTASVNDWQGYTGRKRDVFNAVTPLPLKGPNTIELAASDFINEKGEKMKDWDEITELAFQPAHKVKQGGKENWKGNPPVLENLRWVGGKFIKRPYPYQPRGGNYSNNAGSWDDEFQNAIKDSVKLEEQDNEFYTPAADKAAVNKTSTETDAALPSALILGDSISIGYTPMVIKELKGVVNVSRAKTNCGDSNRYLKSLNNWLGDTKWDVIHFNVGLHDLCYRHPDSKVYGHRDKVNGTIAVPLDEYEKNLERIVVQLKKTGAKLIWASTTIVPEGEAGRIVGDEIKYNKVALKIMKKHGVAINDLHALTTSFPKELFAKPGDVHFKKEGSAKLAKQVAEQIKKQL